MRIMGVKSSILSQIPRRLSPHLLFVPLVTRRMVATPLLAICDFPNYLIFRLKQLTIEPLLLDSISL